MPEPPPTGSMVHGCGGGQRHAVTVSMTAVWHDDRKSTSHWRLAQGLCLTAAKSRIRSAGQLYFQAGIQKTTQ